jgi:hydrogenase maturation protein HypF
VTELSGTRIHITGIVQGVGFRPFVYGLAKRYELCGWVRNTSAGVDIEVDGSPDALVSFRQALQDEAPPLARIDRFESSERPVNGFQSFEIVHSQSISDVSQPVSPDVSICDDCLGELFEPDDRRYRYPFINCTNCGPRFTIIQDIPYDRPQTTMAPFPMCPDCRQEYENPLDRRFHAQPVACPLCGPHVWLEGDERLLTGSRLPKGEAAIEKSRQLLREGEILAIRGLGGFHLACDAANPAAVAELRRRKLRVDKPFALMLHDLTAVDRHCFVNSAEGEILQSRERPIVILQRRPESPIADAVAPGQRTLGMMLPYTPLHHLLLQPGPNFPDALVMTSGNLAEEPIATDIDEARQRLAPLADAFLMHDRDIYIRCDDSVVRVFDKGVYPLRRSRGYAPFPVRLPWEARPLLAVGAELKNTFCLASGDYAFLGQHIGDLENLETLRSFESGVAHFERLFRVRPELLAYDLHPDYLATRYALARAERENLPATGVQHHHAHVAACLAEHGNPGDRPVIGVSFDGSGYGPDGAIWGGEFLVADYAGYQRAAHLAYVPLPGGDKAVREPWRMALAHLYQAGIEWSADLPSLANNGQADEQALNILRQQIEKQINAPPTSSMGRLFDAVSALAGLRQVVNYEGQAAIELEALVDPAEEGFYAFVVGEQIDAGPTIRGVTADVRAGVSPAIIAARFHNGVAHLARDVCVWQREQHGLKEVVLSGGVFQNITLLAETHRLLREAGFEVLVHRQVPANDGGLALGQAAVALWRSLCA